MLISLAFFFVTLIITLKLILEAISPCRNSEAIETWADERRFEIRRLGRHPRPLGLRFGPSSFAQQFYWVEVVCPAGQTMRYVVKTGGYFLGRHVRRLKAYLADDQASR